MKFIRKQNMIQSKHNIAILTFAHVNLKKRLISSWQTLSNIPIRCKKPLQNVNLQGLAMFRRGTSYTTKEILKPLQNNYLQGFVYLVSHSVSQTTVFSAEIYLILPGFILLNSFDFVDPVLNI